ncbi:MAG: undecaprenyl/decaprenyl-phosphate alpha-N-acetylglucosaminyl 1-phosphate transferase [Verrucomicrobia bacterium]|jgi:UDP-GlcNAc:undecaprenyl-phosphate GlcNAc-1-phosphate transferase|nr:MAG: undecaprenyl/decaprenyl-phosphate alpha-N-acetylglucosaminyl 1-phosphate transferase [Verrucomicrobiota bacterium]
MNFPFSVYLAAFVGALVTSFFALPLWRAWCIRIGLVDDPGHRKIHNSPIPLAGGLAVLTGLLVPLVIATFLLKFNLFGEATTAPLLHGLSKRAWQLAAIAFGGIGMTILGLLDDKQELDPLQKFAGQLLIALIVACSGVRITLFIPNLAVSHCVTILWLLTVINAFNFMDNMNGLCSGLGYIGAGFFALIAAFHGQYLVTIIALLTCGALLGFLPYNFPKARAFLGDSGSHLVGYLLAILAILPHFINRDQPNRLAIISPLLVLAVPLGDLAWVVLIRWRKGQPFYVGDTNHLSHRLVRAGLSRTTAVMMIWLIALAIGTTSLLLAAR